MDVVGTVEQVVSLFCSRSGYFDPANLLLLLLLSLLLFLLLILLLLLLLLLVLLQEQWSRWRVFCAPARSGYFDQASLYYCADQD